ncbi:MAG TPA: ADYC domain-containing protein [Kofleriaceae bacterium]|jgi:hypothetical protein|nr:ADYC domain-containing protein [Kofleriaceae bacterium]
MPPTGPEGSAPACTAPEHHANAPDLTCTSGTCGTNSPIVNNFPINGLSKRADGACNASGVQLLAHSLEGGGCGKAADLELDPGGTRLIGMRNGQVVCTGEQLAGATFLVRSFASSALAFTIASVRPIITLDGRAQYEGYRIESGGVPACDSAAALSIRRKLGLVDTEAPVGALPKPVGDPSGPPDDLVIAVDGPLYDRADKLIPGSQDRWFNLACARDSLAKRSLYGLYTPGDDATNETALHMLTANYCGKPYTVPGVELEWEAHSIPKLRQEEALWHGGKAICIDTPRLMTLAAGNNPIAPADLPAQLQPRGCAGQNCDADRWTQALLAECRLPTCKKLSGMPPPQFEFDSFDFKTDQNQIIVGVAKH